MHGPRCAPTHGYGLCESHAPAERPETEAPQVNWDRALMVRPSSTTQTVSSIYRDLGSGSRVTLGLLVILAAGCRPQTAQQTASLDATRGSAPAATSSTYPDDGQWVRPGKDYQGTRFSGLTEINTQNVASMKVVSTFATGSIRGHEAAPIVANGTMFVVTPYPNIVYALDLTKPGFPIKWTYHPKPSSSAQGVACCDVVNRGGVYDNGRFF